VCWVDHELSCAVKERREGERDIDLGECGRNGARSESECAADGFAYAGDWLKKKIIS